MSDYRGRGPDGRKLVAVVHADMVGYSRLIGLDDTGTLARLRALRATLFDPIIARFGGRVVQTAGDSLLMLFDSVTDAVSCAVVLQQAVPDHDPAHSAGRAIIFRMGVDLGDVIADEADFHGNGLIIAARLQAVCPPGHVCVSRTVRDHVAGRLDLVFDPMGELSLKNVARPVEAFVVAPQATPATDPTPASAPAFVPAQTPTPPFSLVVLPFANTSGQASDDHLVDAIGDDLTTELSRIAGHRVIARTTAATYRGHAVDARRIGAELRVHYVIEGSARKFGHVLRLNIQLIAAPDNTRLWGDRFEQDMTDIGAGIDVVVRKIAGVLDIQILDAEIARRTRARPGRPDAYDHVMRSWAAWNRPHTALLQAEVTASLEEALRLDPSLVPAMQSLASWLTYRFDGFIDSPDWGDNTLVERAADVLAAGLQIDPNNDELLLAEVRKLRTTGHRAEAAAACQRLLELYPNLGRAHRELGRHRMATGQPEEAIRLFEAMIRLDPMSSLNSSNRAMIGKCHLLLQRNSEAVLWLSRALAELPGEHWFARADKQLWLASAHASAGDVEAARHALDEAIILWPGATVQALMPGPEPRGCATLAYTAQFAYVQGGLRRAGLRENAPAEQGINLPPAEGPLPGLIGPTPGSIPGATTIRTAELVQLMGERPLLIDDAVGSWGRSLPGAIGLQGAGHSVFVDSMQRRLARTMDLLTDNNRDRPIVAFAVNAERRTGHNLALRLVELGYTRVYWYRGGIEAWRADGHADSKLTLLAWEGKAGPDRRPTNV